MGSGSFTRSGVNYQAGAKTPMSAIFAALFLGVVLLALAGVYLWSSSIGSDIDRTQSEIAAVQRELDALMKLEHRYEQFIVQALIGNSGWGGYALSKAALNMLIKNFAIELARKKPAHIVVGLQPGTTDSALSAPFQRNVPAEQLQTPDYTAAQLLRVMDALRVEDSGGLFDFLGLPFAP